MPRIKPADRTPTAAGIGSADQLKDELHDRNDKKQPPETENDARYRGQQFNQERSRAAKASGSDFREIRRRADAERHGQRHRDE